MLKTNIENLIIIFRNKSKHEADYKYRIFFRGKHCLNFDYADSWISLIGEGIMVIKIITLIQVQTWRGQ
jgi:hypothetical protein